MAGETLKITGGNATGQTITLEQELVIGRSTPGLGSLGGDSEISRVHARVFHDPSGRLIVEDLGSTNGTFVNGNRISGQQALNPGDQVRVGQTTLAVEGGAGAGATTVGNVIQPPPAAAQPAPPAAVAATPPTQQLPPQQPYGQGPGAPPPPAGPGYGGGPGPNGGGGTNRNLLIALAAVVVIALIVAGLAIGGVFGGSDKKSNTTAQTTPTTAATTPTIAMPSTPTETNTQADTGSSGGGGGGGGGSSSGGYPSTFKSQFVRGCASSGKLSSSQCRCIINKAEKAYSLPQFVSAVRRSQGGTVPPKLRSIFVACA